MRRLQESKHTDSRHSLQTPPGRSIGVEGSRRAGRLQFSLWMVCVVGALSLAPLASASEATCKPFTDASEKTSRTANHSHSVQTIEGATKAMAMLGMDKPMVVEQYNTGAKTYLFTPKDGKWTSMPSNTVSNAFTSSEYKQQLQKTECSVLRTESVDGEAATVFLSMTTDPSNRTTTWISQASGLILREDVDVEVARSTKSHSSATYDYKNIQLPPGAK